MLMAFPEPTTLKMRNDFTNHLSIRKGKTLFITLAGAHSLWAGNNCMLCVANGILYRNIQGHAVNIGAVAGPKHPFSYIDVDDKVYISNSYWQGVFDPATNSVLPWGVPQHPGPKPL